MLGTKGTTSFTPYQIMELIAKIEGIPLNEFLSRRRKPVQYRMMGHYLCYAKTPESSKRIGRALQSHHTTIIHSYRRIEALRQSDSRIAAKLALYESSLGS